VARKGRRRRNKKKKKKEKKENGRVTWVNCEADDLMMVEIKEVQHRGQKESYIPKHLC
jgi:hypothetical protein